MKTSIAIALGFLALGYAALAFSNDRPLGHVAIPTITGIAVLWGGLRRTRRAR